MIFDDDQAQYYRLYSTYPIRCALFFFSLLYIRKIVLNQGIMMVLLRWIFFIYNQHLFYNDIHNIFKHQMKINIKLGCDCVPSEVDQKKNNMLYAPPEKDTKKKINQPNPNRQAVSEHKSRVNKNDEKYKQSEKQMLKQLQKAGKNKANLDMIQNTNKIQQQQTQILYENQKNVNQLLKEKQNQKGKVQENNRKGYDQALQKMNEEVKEIKKIREEMVVMIKDFNKNLNEMKNGKSNLNNIPQISNANQNYRDLVQVSKNHLSGLQNLEGLKSLQNFNVEQYTQAINSIKRQIAQYQKQSENIERELRIRAAKLQKLQVPPNFQKQLLQPYQNHLTEKVNNIDLHSLKEKVYEKLGHFDYGKFEYSVGEIMLEAKSELGNFDLIRQEYKINAPDIKIDTKELKNLQFKMPSVLDQYKASKGIFFEEKKENNKNTGNKGSTHSDGLKKTHQIKDIVSKPRQNNIKKIVTKPIDKASNVRLTKITDPPKTILINTEKKEKKELQQKMKRTSRQKKKQDEDFEKYLQNRARQQLQEIYRERKRKLQKMQQDLNEECKEPTYINLDLRKQDVKRQRPKLRQQERKEEVEEEYEDEFEREEEQIKKEQEKKEVNPIKQLGKDVLKQKLKSILKNKQKQQRNDEFIRNNRYQQDPGMQVQNVAEGVISLINNTLAQVNHNIANTIQRKISHEKEKRPQFERRSPKKLQIPKLQEFRAPPILKMQVSYPQQAHHRTEQSTQKKQNKKIELKNYQHLNINYEKEESYENESFDDLRISDMNE